MSGSSELPVTLTPQGERRQLHKLTPLLVGGQAAITIFVILFFVALGQTSSNIPVGIGIAAGAGLGIVVAVLVAGFQYLAWQRFWFWFDDDGDFRIDSGVVNLNRRRLQLSRMQSVEVTEPILARIFSLAVVTVDVAGVSGSKVKLAYLSKADAEDLRVELLTRASGVSTESTSDQVVEGSDLVEGEVIAEVSSGSLALSLALRSSTFFLIALTITIAVISFLNDGLAGIGFMFITGGIPAAAILFEFINYYGFTMRRSANGVRLKYGLLQTQHQTIPPGRIAAVDVVQPLLWRFKSWVRIRVTVAGVAGDSEGSSGGLESVLIPVAHRDEAMSLLTQLLSGADIDAIDLAPVVDKAKWRAPFQWRYLGVGHDDLVFVARRGWITRHLTVVPHARTQSVRVEQGPYLRLLGLATLAVDVAPGPVKSLALYRTHDEALRMSNEQVTRARLARSNDISARWASTK